MTWSHWMGPILEGWNKQATTCIVILKGFLLQNCAVFGLFFFDDPCRWWFQRFCCWFTPITKAAYITIQGFNPVTCDFGDGMKWYNSTDDTGVESTVLYGKCTHGSSGKISQFFAKLAFLFSLSFSLSETLVFRQHAQPTIHSKGFGDVHTISCLYISI